MNLQVVVLLGATFFPRTNAAVTFYTAVTFIPPSITATTQTTIGRVPGPTGHSGFPVNVDTSAGHRVSIFIYIFILGGAIVFFLIVAVALRAIVNAARRRHFRSRGNGARAVMIEPPKPEFYERYLDLGASETAGTEQTGSSWMDFSPLTASNSLGGEHSAAIKSPSRRILATLPNVLPKESKVEQTIPPKAQVRNISSSMFILMPRQRIGLQDSDDLPELALGMANSKVYSA